MDLVKQHYFIDNHVQEVLNYIPNNMTGLESFLYSILKLCGKGESVFSSHLKKNPNKESYMVKMGDEYLSDFDLFDTSKGQIFESSSFMLKKIKENSIYKMNKRCIFINIKMSRCSYHLFFI